MALTDRDRAHLARAVDLAQEALDAGDEPFGTVLVSGEGDVLFEDRNRALSGDLLQHPEFTAAQWALAHLDERARRDCTVYTSGEHCPMCAAAHGWVGLGRIVYALSAQELVALRTEAGATASAVAPLPVDVVVPGIAVDGSDPAAAERIRELHRRFAATHP